MSIARRSKAWLIRVGVATAILTGAGLFAGPGQGGAAFARPADDMLGPVIPALDAPPGIVVEQPKAPEAGSDPDAASATRMIVFFAAVWLVASLRIGRLKGRWRIGFAPAETRRTPSRPAIRRSIAAGNASGGVGGSRSY